MTLSQKLQDPYFYETPLPRVALMQPKIKVENQASVTKQEQQRKQTCSPGKFTSPAQSSKVILPQFTSPQQVKSYSQKRTNIISQTPPVNLKERKQLLITKKTTTSDYMNYQAKVASPLIQRLSKPKHFVPIRSAESKNVRGPSINKVSVISHELSFHSPEQVKIPIPQETKSSTSHLRFRPQK